MQLFGNSFVPPDHFFELFHWDCVDNIPGLPLRLPPTVAVSPGDWNEKDIAAFFTVAKRRDRDVSKIGSSPLMKHYIDWYFLNLFCQKVRSLIDCLQMMRTLPTAPAGRRQHRGSRGRRELPSPTTSCRPWREASRSRNISQSRTDRSWRPSWTCLTPRWRPGTRTGGPSGREPPAWAWNCCRTVRTSWPCSRLSTEILTPEPTLHL